MLLPCKKDAAGSNPVIGLNEILFRRNIMFGPIVVVLAIAGIAFAIWHNMTKQTKEAIDAELRKEALDAANDVKAEAKRDIKKL